VISEFFVDLSWGGCREGSLEQWEKDGWKREEKQEDTRQVEQDNEGVHLVAQPRRVRAVAGCSKRLDHDLQRMEYRYIDIRRWVRTGLECLHPDIVQHRRNSDQQRNNSEIVDRSPLDLLHT